MKQTKSQRQFPGKSDNNNRKMIYSFPYHFEHINSPKPHPTRFRLIERQGAALQQTNWNNSDIIQMIVVYPNQIESISLVQILRGVLDGSPLLASSLTFPSRRQGLLLIPPLVIDR